MTSHRIAVIPGDGIGSEVIASTRAVLDAVSARHEIDLDYREFDWSCRRYQRDGAMMPADGIDTLSTYDAILLGAVGWPDVRFDKEHIDALAAKFVLQPQRFDVVVGSNLFGDILSDLAAAVAGSICIAPSANLDPTRHHPSMFEPVHGSAPDIAGKGVANPIGAVWSAAMMLDHLGHAAAAADVIAAMETTLAKPETRTADLGGTATTDQVTGALVAQLR